MKHLAFVSLYIEISTHNQIDIDYAKQMIDISVISVYIDAFILLWVYYISGRIKFNPSK